MTEKFPAAGLWNTNFKLLRLTAATYAATREAWESQILELGDSIFPTEHYRVLDSASARIEVADAPSISIPYAIIRNDRTFADAIADVVYTNAGADNRLKMLDISLSPGIDFDVVGLNIAIIHEAVGMFGATVIGLMELGKELPASVIKLYGRTSSSLEFLRFFGSELSTKLSDIGIGIVVAIEGRWLVIKRV